MNRDRPLRVGFLHLGRERSGLRRYGAILATEAARRLAGVPPQARADPDRLWGIAGGRRRYVSVGTRRDQIIEV